MSTDCLEGPEDGAGPASQPWLCVNAKSEPAPPHPATSIDSVALR